MFFPPSMWPTKFLSADLGMGEIHVRDMRVEGQDRTVVEGLRHNGAVTHIKHVDENLILVNGLRSSVGHPVLAKRIHRG